MEMEGDENGGLQQPSCSDSGHILAVRKIMEQELEPTVLKIVGREALPTVISIEDFIRGVAREESLSLMEKKHLVGGTRNDSPEDRTLRLKFLDELPDTVLTGTVLISKENEVLKLALHNSEERIVERGPGSSAKVEVVVLEANDNDDENNMTGEEFESRIIKTGEKKKPHFAKDVYIYLKEGIGKLTGVKFGHGSDWIKKCKYRLGAKMGQNLNGFMVQEAWTPPFEVKDKRVKNNEKHDLPKLDSEVWRLDNIARNGVLHKQLEGKNIETLRDFLFWFHVNPEGLKRILRHYWKAIVTHANKTCISDDKIYSHKSSSEPQISVVYTAVGKLKGVINESQFVRIDDLSADEKEDAYKLLMSVLEPSAFGHRYNIFFDDEASLLQQYPLTDPQNSGGAGLSKSVLGLEYHFPPISLPSEEPQINAGASEDEMRKKSSRPSTTNSFLENGTQDSGTFISFTDLVENSIGFQGWETFFDDGASCLPDFPLTDHQNFDETTHLDPGLSFEDFHFQTSLLSEIHKDEINAGASENEIRESSRRRSTMHSFEENGMRDFGTSISTDDDGTWQQYIAADKFLGGVEESQHYGAYAGPHVVFSRRDVPKGWKLVKFVVCVPTWWFSITVRVSRPHVTRKRKR